MNRITVKSSNIAAIGYDPGTETMEVEFKPKDEETPPRVYQYDKVPYDDYKAFLNAESVGRHFHTFVRSNYESHRIDLTREEEKRHGEAKESKKKGIS